MLIGGLFLALQANRRWLTDLTLKSQYLDNVKKTQEQTLVLLNDLSVKPPDIPDCHNTKRKRQAGHMSEKKLRALLLDRGVIDSIGKAIGGIVKDVGSLIGCATNVVKNLADEVNKSTPDLGVIENLTDTLAAIGTDLEEDGDDDDDGKSSKAGQSSSAATITSSQSGLSSSSQTSSSASSSSSGLEAPPNWNPDPIGGIDTDALNIIATQIALKDSLVSLFSVTRISSS